MDRWGVAWFRMALRWALPAWLHEQAGADILRAFREGQRAARQRGVPALLRFWLLETAGLVRTGWSARRPDSWTRTTAPVTAPLRTPSNRPTMDSLGSDFRFALRTFARRPGMVVLAVLTLSLGIGSSTAMFSVIDSVLLESLDYPEPDELHAVYPAWPQLQGHPTLGELALRGTWSWPEFWLVSEQEQVFDFFAGYSPAQVTLSSEEGRPERVAVGVTSWELFPMLGAGTRLGRIFDEGDGRDGGRVALLSHGAWQDRFGADPDVIGRTLRLNDNAYTVIGVLADGFEVTGMDRSIWLPRAGSSTDDGLGNHGGTRALARLADGVTKEQARGEVERILQSLPADHGVHGATVEPFQAELTRGVRPVLMIMLAASGLLLVVACGNVASLLLGAGIDRERELAVRGAMGATRGRLSQQLLTESTILALAGAMGGVGVAALTTRALTFLAPPGVPRIADVGVDGGILMFAVGLAMLCGIAFGLIPALSLSSTDLASSIGTTRTTGSRRARLQSAVVAGELALATVLVVGGLLLARTVSALNRVDPGFDHEGLVTLSVAFPSARFSTGDAEEDQRAATAYRDELVDAVSSLPGVAGVHVSTSPPFFGWRANNDVVPEGWGDPQNAPMAERRFVTPGYFEFMGIPLLEGRGFEATDDAGSETVVVVSRGLAELAWPGESAVGKRVTYWGRDATVVGVADNIRDEQLEGSTDLAFYGPAAQGAGQGSPFVVRAANGDAAALIPAIRERIWSVDPDVPITRVATTADLMSAQLAQQRYRARLMSVFAGMAALFALLGIYGVTSRSVARRTREIGIRAALGAERGRVHGMVTIEAVRLSVYGVVVGLIAAVLLGAALERFLWGVTRSDPVTLALVGLGIPFLAALAAVPPARRATRVDPLEALRAE